MRFIRMRRSPQRRIGKMLDIATRRLFLRLSSSTAAAVLLYASGLSAKEAGTGGKGKGPKYQGGRSHTEGGHDDGHSDGGHSDGGHDDGHTDEGHEDVDDGHADGGVEDDGHEEGSHEDGDDDHADGGGKGRGPKYKGGRVSTGEAGDSGLLEDQVLKRPITE
jgi:hypothetical protein